MDCSALAGFLLRGYDLRSGALLFLTYGAVVIGAALLLTLIVSVAYLVTMLALWLLKDAEEYRERTKP